MSNIELECKRCKTKFKKKKNEYNRQLKNGRSYFFCTRSCSSKFAHRPGRNYSYSNSEKNKNNLKKHHGNLRDEFTPFRWFLLRCKKREKESIRKTCQIGLVLLKSLFEEQKGVCPITGWKLKLPESTKGFKEKSI